MVNEDRVDDEEVHQILSSKHFVFFIFVRTVIFDSIQYIIIMMYIIILYNVMSYSCTDRDLYYMHKSIY